jgi:hypothetical protein
MDEPIVHHELNPGGSEEVEDRGGLESFARHQFATHYARVGLQKTSGVRVDFREWKVSAEARALSAHMRALEIVPGPVDGPALPHSIVHRSGVNFQRRLFRVVQILFPKLVANFDEPWHREEARELVPRSVTVQEIANSRKQRIAHETSDFKCAQRRLSPPDSFWQKYVRNQR